MHKQNIVHLPKRSLYELPLNQYQTVLSLRILQGRFGQVPLVELQNFVVFLPGRATEQLRIQGARPALSETINFTILSLRIYTNKYDKP
ncbi:unnamed protein product [Acanthoscelides obtectus]|uniref:Uncharacterized protein n=1 Tax=Acanthoscelides obtectus TaxID=200917 RepID=A0A9P0L9V2_ACAOB|nr:unnamed protein product [Acanthoscelides obtectus]CAK1655233.1 hypothetical protein AOBTE_LOCUS19092 [Acanthoscelides obtectus]